MQFLVQPHDNTKGHLVEHLTKLINKYAGLLSRVPFETFQEEEYMEKVFQTPPIPVQMEQKSFYSGIKFHSPSKSITTIPAIPALPLSKLEQTE